MLRSFNSSALYSSTTLYLFPPDADEPPLTLPVSTFLPSSNSDLVVHDDNTPNDEASPSIVSLLRVSSIPGNPDSLQLLLLQTTSTTTSKTLLTLSLQTGQIESTSSASPSTSDISPNGCTFVSVTSREITVTTDTTFTISKKFDEDISTARFLTNDMLVVITSNSKTYRFTCLKIPPPQPPVEQGWLDWSLKLIHLRSPTLKSIYICEGSKKSVYVSSNTITSINLNGRIEITTQKRSVSVDVKINEKAVDLIKDLRDLESLTSYLHTILESIKGVKVIEDILEKLRIRGDEIGCGIEINKVVEDVEICKNVWTVLVSSLGKGDEVECEDEEIKTYVDYLINDKIEEECITLNEIFKCYRKKGSFRKNSKFLKLLYGPVLWDVFWSKNIEDIEIKLNLNRIECCEGILLGLNSSELKMDLGKLISFIVRKGRDNDEVRMLEFHNTVKESLNLSTENIVRGFIWSKKASSVVEEITEKMERKTMGDIGKWDGREWREIESTARKLILLGDDVYGKIVEEQIHLKDVEECLKIEKLCLGCKLGSEIKEKYKTSEQENDYLSKNWSSVFSTVHSRKDEHINVMFVSDTSLKKPLQIHLPRYNNKSMLALRRAELLACTWRSELSHTALILKAISNLEIVDSRIPRAAVSRAIFAMMSPIIRLLICNDFSNAVGFEEEDFENEEGTSILNDKKWAREVLKVGKRLLEFINDKGGGGDKVVGAVVEDRGET
ncbi:hypothetical protein TrLO_g568 [Triparma laevis f. longispina]|uniref:Uncharacterized protein n=1 Tax=Triparma laevis f. longispina TaxID=1714387 RepID=A0A9W7A889_9STRA|nr:hypothetical protein TrLO_g568 [Triparma laevis f. longispina]